MYGGLSLVVDGIGSFGVGDVGAVGGSYIGGFAGPNEAFYALLPYLVL